MTLYLGNQKVCPTRTINSGGERYLIQASDESMLPDWYRIYSDGWCEQGGKVWHDEVYQELELLIPYKHYDTWANMSCYNGSVSAIIQSDDTTVAIVGTNTSSGFYWETKGFIDLSQLEENE